MGERDCGNWYCQDAAGFGELKQGEDILFYPGPRANPESQKELERERTGLTGQCCPPSREKNVPIGGWFGDNRNFKGWLAAYNHGNGKARYFWMWDPDSTQKYLEAQGPYKPGTVPSDFGSLHRGRGWQLPLLAVIDGKPTSGDLKILQKAQCPYMILGDDVPPPPPPPPPPPTPTDGEDTELRASLLVTLGKVIDALEDLESELS